MAIPSIVLTKGQILVTQGDSILGIKSLDGKVMFGYVSKIYATSGFIAEGDCIQFDPSKASRIIYGSTQYYLVDEQYVSGNEGAAP